MATLTLRTTKGSPLTSAEVDSNFLQLDLTKVQLAGDLGGSTSSPVVISLRGFSVSSATPVTGQTLVYSGSAWVPTTLPSSSSVVNNIVLDDITNYINGKTQVFTLKNNAVEIIEGTTYKDNRDFTVTFGGRAYNPLVPQSSTLGPWITEFTAGKTFEFKVVGSKLILYRSPERASAQIRINTVSASRQTKLRYPFTASTIVFGD